MLQIYHAEHFVPAGTEAALWASVRDDTYVNPLLLPIRSSTPVFNENTVSHWIPGMDILSRRLRWILTRTYLSWTLQQNRLAIHDLQVGDEGAVGGGLGLHGVLDQAGEAVAGFLAVRRLKRKTYSSR